MQSPIFSSLIGPYMHCANRTVPLPPPTPRDLYKSAPLKNFYFSWLQPISLLHSAFKAVHWALNGKSGCQENTPWTAAHGANGAALLATSFVHSTAAYHTHCRSDFWSPKPCTPWPNGGPSLNFIGCSMTHQWLT